MVSPYYNPARVSPGQRATAEYISGEFEKIAAAFAQLPPAPAIAVGAGLPALIHLAWSDSADGSSNFTTGAPGSRDYIGFATNRTTSAPSQVPTDYVWYRLAGRDAPLTILQFATAFDGPWHSGFVTGDLYWRQSVDGGVTFTPSALLAAPDLESLDPAAAAALAAAGGSPRLSVLSDVLIQADHLGVVAAGQLPFIVSPRRYRGATDVTATTVWTMTLGPGITATINNTDGAATRGRVTITALEVAETSVRVVSTRDGVPIEQTFKVRRQNAAAPAQAGPMATAQPGAAASDTSFNAIGSSAAFIALTDVLKVRVGTAAGVDLLAQLSFGASDSSSQIVTHCEMVWRYSADGVTAFTDVGLPQESAYGARTSTGFLAAGEPNYEQEYGYLDISRTKTGLTNNTDAHFQLFGRKTSGPASIISIYGSASATPQ